MVIKSNNFLKFQLKGIGTAHTHQIYMQSNNVINCCSSLVLSAHFDKLCSAVKMANKRKKIRVLQKGNHVD